MQKFGKFHKDRVKIQIWGKSVIFFLMSYVCTFDADERKRMQNFSAAFFVRAVICLGLESLSPPILVPCW